MPDLVNRWSGWEWEHLSNDVKIVMTLHDNGGRMRQSDLCERVDMSSSTVSRHVQNLSDEGLVDKVRLSHTNLLVLDYSKGAVS